MERQTNPYRPGFNQRPVRLVGRDQILAAAQENMDVAELDRRMPTPLILVGTRGVGKTVVLGRIAEDAATTRSWPHVGIEIRPDAPFTPELLQRLEEATASLRQQTPTSTQRSRVSGGKVSAQVFGIGAEVDVIRAEKPPSAVPLDTAMEAAARAAMACDAGLVLTIDELQLANRSELSNLTAVLQQHIDDGWPIVLVAAGLPSLRERDRTVSYLERAQWEDLRPLSREHTLDALTGPAAAASRPMDPAAAAILADACGGYPFAVQLMGHHAWRASHGSATIEAPHARTARTAAHRALSAGLYASRWQDAAPREREYLAALAALPTGGGGGDVARALGRPPADVSYLRDRLIKKGTLYPEGGLLRFIVPGLGDWIREQGDLP